MYLPSLVLGMAMVNAVIAQSPSLGSLLAGTPDLSTLTTLVTQQKGLLDTLEKATNITILAPTNEAFATFLASSDYAKYKNNPDAISALLEYHVLKGIYPASAFKSTPVFVHSLSEDKKFSNVTGGQVVEGVLKGDVVEIISGELAVSKVIKADIKFAGGVVHVIDKVLTLPDTGAVTSAKNGYTAINTALIATGLQPVLRSLSDVTVFVPTNAAFEAISSVSSKLSKEELAAVLKLHAIQKTGTVYYSSELKDGDSLTTLNGEALKISIVDGTVFVNKAKVLVPNFLTQNGVFHVIDSVLLPTTSNSTNTSPTASSKTTPNNPTGSPIVPYTNIASSQGFSAFGTAAAIMFAAWINA